MSDEYQTVVTTMTQISHTIVEIINAPLMSDEDPMTQ